jgi:PAS domain S-box-containing protein
VRSIHRTGSGLQLVARVAGGRPSSGKVGSADVSPQLTQAMERSPQKGVFVSHTALDGIERTNAYQHIESYGLVVLTGLATEEFYAPWRSEAAQLATLVLIILAVLGAASALLERSRRAKLTALESLAELTREQSAMLDNELIGIVKATERRTIWMNRAMERIFGYRAEELIGHSARLLHVDDASYESLAAAYPAMQGGQHFRTQLQMRRKGGELIWIDLTGTMLSATETLWLMADVTLQKRNEEQIRHAALHDALTGCRIAPCFRLEWMRRCVPLRNCSRWWRSRCWISTDSRPSTTATVMALAMRC